MSRPASKSNSGQSTYEWTSVHIQPQGVISEACRPRHSMVCGLGSFRHRISRSSTRARNRPFGHFGCICQAGRRLDWICWRCERRRRNYWCHPRDVGLGFIIDEHCQRRQCDDCGVSTYLWPIPRSPVCFIRKTSPLKKSRSAASSDSMASLQAWLSGSLEEVV